MWGRIAAMSLCLLIVRLLIVRLLIVILLMLVLMLVWPCVAVDATGAVIPCRRRDRVDALRLQAQSTVESGAAANVLLASRIAGGRHRVEGAGVRTPTACVTNEGGMFALCVCVAHRFVIRVSSYSSLACCSAIPMVGRPQKPCRPWRS